MKKKNRSTLLILPALLIISLTIFGIRIMLANLAIAREWRSGPIQVFNHETTSLLEIIPLYEEASDRPEFLSGHGVSYLIRTDLGTILMDVGNNLEQKTLPPFAKNLLTLEISAQEIDSIVISHLHPDHVGGVAAWNKKTVFLGRPSSDFENIPVFLPSAFWLPTTPNAVVSRIPVQVLPDVATIGVISYPEVFPLNLFEPKGTEQALVVNVAGEGLVLITGCGHPGLERLFIRIESLYDLPIVGIVGELHFEDSKSSDVQPQILFLKSYQPKLVALSSHDSGPLALDAFQSAFGKNYKTLRVGETVQFP